MFQKKLSQVQSYTLTLLINWLKILIEYQIFIRSNYCNIIIMNHLTMFDYHKILWYAEISKFNNLLTLNWSSAYRFSFVLFQMLLFHHFDGKDKLGWSLVYSCSVYFCRFVVTTATWWVAFVQYTVKCKAQEEFAILLLTQGKNRMAGCRVESKLTKMYTTKRMKPLTYRYVGNLQALNAVIC